MRTLIIMAMLVAGLVFSGQAFADAAGTYAGKCAMCHGKDGGGGAMAPALKGSDFIKGDAAAVKSVILEGRQGGDKKYSNFSIGMPKFQLSDADADALVDYLKGL
ncbi:MAG: cytochrome c [Deltaproteobacteria bacterium]|nr:cytochrome c [Deltaproteobacteria bacterium]